MSTGINSELRKDCPMRHPDNGNCTVAGGFCTAVNDPICEALHNAFNCGERSKIEWATLEVAKQNAVHTVKALEALREIQERAAQPKWMPLTERMPERMKPVICLYENEDGTQVGGGYANDFGFWTLIAPAKGRVTHWMPLPQPPEEVQNDG